MMQLNIQKKQKLIGSITIIVIIVLIVCFVFIRGLFEQTAPKVTKTVPTSGAIEIPEEQTISITFDKKIKDQNKAKISVTLTPSIDLKKAWPENNQITLTPRRGFNKETEYTVVVEYASQKMHEFKFTTVAYTEEERWTYIKEQLAGDISYAQEIDKMQKTYSWFSKMPIDTAEYVIVYDFDKESFRIRLKTSEDSPKEVQDDLLNKALAELKSINVDIEKEGYYVLYQN